MALRAAASGAYKLFVLAVGMVGKDFICDLNGGADADMGVLRSTLSVRKLSRRKQNRPQLESQTCDILSGYYARYKKSNSRETICP